MILEFEDEKRLLDDATRELMQTCSQAAQKAEGVTLPLSVFIRVVDDDADPRHQPRAAGQGRRDRRVILSRR